MRVLKKKGILLGAHIPMGPSGLALERSQMDEFQGFAASLLDASELARANRGASLRASGNLPWNRCVFSVHTPYALVRRSYG